MSVVADFCCFQSPAAHKFRYRKQIRQLPFLPQVAELPVTETISFLTDSFTNYDGTEQHIQLRSKPRQQFQYSIPIKYRDNADVFNSLYGAIREKWAVPIWSELQPVGNITSGAITINCENYK